jgi:hypothetical protein
VTIGGDYADGSTLVEREVCPPLHRRRAEPPLVLPPKHVAAVMPDEARPGGCGGRPLDLDQPVRADAGGLRGGQAGLRHEGVHRVAGLVDTAGHSSAVRKARARRHEQRVGADRFDYSLLQIVPWVLYSDKPRAMHGALWPNGYGYAGSHGCVNLSPTDAHWLCDWAEGGTYVHVLDPSGHTSTDPETHSEGGA